MVKKTDTKSPTPKTENDKLEDQLVEAVALAILDRLKTYVEGKHRDRRIRDLTMPHLRLLASDGICAYIKTRTELEAANPDPWGWADRQPAVDSDLNDPLPDHLLS